MNNYAIQHRPKKLDDFFGSSLLNTKLEKFLKNPASIPNVVLLFGPSGCGKTTIARLLANALVHSEDAIHEKNSADARGIDEARSISTLTKLSGRKVFILDEFHQTTKDFQNCILKTLEDSGEERRNFFFLASTDPSKIIQTIKTRCTEIIEVKFPSKEQKRELAKYLYKNESAVKSIPPEIIKQTFDIQLSFREYANLIENLCTTDSSNYESVLEQFSLFMADAPAIVRDLLSKVFDQDVQSALQVLWKIEKETNISPESLRLQLIYMVRSKIKRGRLPAENIHKLRALEHFTTYKNFMGNDCWSVFESSLIDFCLDKFDGG